MKYIFSHLLSNGANINSQDQHGNTLLHYASMRGNSSIVDFAIKNNINASIINNDKLTAYDIALKNNKLDICKKIKHYQIGPLEKMLLQALKDENRFQITIALQSRVKLNFHNWKGETPLQIAIQTSNYNIISLLLLHGANPNLLAEDGSSALHYAVSQKKFSSERIALLLLEKGSDFNYIAPNDYTILFKASSLGFSQVVNKLLLNQVDINFSSNIANATALHGACLHNHYEVVELLIANGADIFKKSPKHGSALNIATNNAYYNISKLLENPVTKLISAAANNYTHLVKKIY
jgi:uncharacterized protein